MKRPIPTSTLLRFPIIFGTFLAVVGYGLIYKDSWLGDIDAKRNELFKENTDTRNLIENLKQEALKKR